MSTSSAWTALAFVGLASTGCNVVLGLGDYKEAGGGGLGGATGATTASATATTEAAAGTGGSGGKGTCLPGQEVACYSGPDGTKNKGVCHEGSEFCDQSGNPGPCQGDVEPITEVCGNGLDDNCDGEVDENCDCTPNMSADCYSGPPATNGVGVCVGGMHICNPDGHGFGACTGEVDPTTEDCSTTADENCNNAEVSGADTASGCVCVPGKTQGCYDGASGTEGVGNCHGGTQTCPADGLSWGSCAGEVVPTTEVCTTVGDEDCNGSGCSDTIWAHGYSIAGGDVTSYSTAFDTAGNVFVALNATGGSVPIGNTSLANRFIIAKLNSLGVVQWVRGYGTNTTYGNAVTGLVSDGTNLYFTGYTADVTAFGASNLSGLFVAKIDNSGTEQWARSCGGSAGQGGHVTVDASNNVYFTGAAEGTVNCGGATLTGSSTYTDVVVAKVTSTNSLVWSKRYSGTAASQGSGIGVDATGNVYVDGSFNGTLSFGTPHTSQGGSDMFVVKLSSANPPVQTWVTTYGDSGTNQRLTELKLDLAGNPIIGGQYTGDVTIGGMTYGFGGIVPTALVAKLGASAGVAQWVKSFGSSVAGLTTDSQDHVILGADTGSFGANLGGGNLAGIILAKLGSDGSYIWGRSLSTGSNLYLGQPATGPADVIALPGAYLGVIDVGTGPLSGNSGNESGLIMEVGP